MKASLSLSLCVAVLMARAAIAAANPATNTPYEVKERGASHRVMQRVLTTTDDATGATTTITNRYTELSNGLHYQDSETGEWKETQERFEIAPDGTAVARHGQHQVILEPNINSITVDFLSPAKERFRSHVLGLYYFDAESGKSVQITKIKDSTGELLPPNQVVYRDAFEGAAASDVRYTYAKGGFEQDVILTSRPAPPEDYGLNPGTTRLEVWTRFIQAPELSRTPHVLKRESDDAKRRKMVEPDLVDEMLKHDGIWFPHGAAFGAKVEATPAAGQPRKVLLRPAGRDGTLAVGKQWLTMNGSKVLVEGVDFSELNAKLAGLGLASKAKQPGLSPIPQQGRSLGEVRTAAMEVKAVDGIKLAASPYEPQGFVLDYLILINSGWMNTLATGITYLVNDAWSPAGTTL